jgi:hypothetical protein
MLLKARPAERSCCTIFSSWLAFFLPNILVHWSGTGEFPVSTLLSQSVNSGPHRWELPSLSLDKLTGI